MENQEFIIRCHFSGVSFPLRTLNARSTVQQLKVLIGIILHCHPETVIIKFGYPPRSLMDGSDFMTLRDINIMSGGTVVVQEDPEVAPILRISFERDFSSMANQEFIIRCLTFKGSFTLQGLNATITIKDLKVHIASILNCNPERLIIQYGYPPSSLVDFMTLEFLNIISGETVIVQEVPEVISISPNNFERDFSTMANHEFIVRCHISGVSFPLRRLSARSTVQQLKVVIGIILECHPETVIIKFGYPPRSLMDGSDFMTLRDINIMSGGTVVVQEDSEVAPILRISFESNFSTMASQEFIIRCITFNNSFTLQDLNARSTVQDLKLSIARILNQDPRTLIIRYGYPPRSIIDGSELMTLEEIDITSGEAIVVQKAPVNQEAPQVIGVGASVNQSFQIKQEFNTVAGIMMRAVMPSNNSCLFSSIHFCLTNGNIDPGKSYELRRIIARVVSEDPEDYSEASLGMSNAAYCRWIVNPDHWGGAIELSILSEHFQIEIVAVDTLTLKCHHFGKDYLYMHRIFLIYSGIHYDPLVIEAQNGATRTIFQVSDVYPMEMALEIAHEAKSSRQFTVANFTLQCEQCEAHFHEDKVARKHTIATGHVHFREINN